MARPRARRVGTADTHDRRAGHSSRGGRAAGASPSRAALHGGLPAPPGAGAAGADAAARAGARLWLQPLSVEVPGDGSHLLKPWPICPAVA